MEAPIMGAIIIASTALIVGAGTIAFKYWHIRRDRNIKATEDFTKVGSSLIDAFKITEDAIQSYNGHFYKLMRLLHQEFPKQKGAVHAFREHLSPTERDSFDKAWDQYHGNDENNPNFIQYEGRSPHGMLLSRIEKILKFTE